MKTRVPPLTLSRRKGRLVGEMVSLCAQRSCFFLVINVITKRLHTVALSKYVASAIELIKVTTLGM